VVGPPGKGFFGYRAPGEEYWNAHVESDEAIELVPQVCVSRQQLSKIAGTGTKLLKRRKAFFARIRRLCLDADRGPEHDKDCTHHHKFLT
jgi:hypothetical protein